jgi:hypothetical protein
MKRFSLLFAALTLWTILFGQNAYLDKPRVDERVELVSIVFRLAGAPEYNHNIYASYVDKIRTHYHPYMDHKIIEFVQQLRATNGVAYDAAMFMAISLDENLDPLVPFTDSIPEARWGRENALEFVRLLKDFYHQTNSTEFFRANEQTYILASERYASVFEKLDADWYPAFYGQAPEEQFIVINSPGNGGNNYGPQIKLPDGQRKVYAIMGTSKTDQAGDPVYTIENNFPILVHEFNHSFINHLIDKNRDLFAESGEKIYETVGTLMQSQAYGVWHTVFKEALVRAAVIKYMKDHDFTPTDISNETLNQLSRGFYWIHDLVSELDSYDQQRNVYPSLESYMPQMANAFEQYAQNIEQYKETFDAKRPHIVSFAEFSNGAQNVDPCTQTITVRFDRELEGKGYSITYGPNGSDHFPEITGIRYAEDKRSLILEVALKPGKEYEMVLLGLAFKSTEGIPLENYTLSFTTCE